MKYKDDAQTSCVASVSRLPPIKSHIEDTDKQVLMFTGKAEKITKSYFHLKKAEDRSIAEKTADSLCPLMSSHHPLGPHHPLHPVQALHVSHLLGMQLHFLEPRW